MPNIKQQEKRDRTNLKAKAYNDSLENGIRTAMKKVEAACKANDKAKAEEALKAAYKKIDEGVTKGAINASSAGRKKSRLAKLVKSIA